MDNSIVINTVSFPRLLDCDILTASEPFYHMDRIADFNVLIYVMEGAIYVTEDETDHSIEAGELFFLKSGIRHYGKREIPKGTRWAYVHFLQPEQELPPFEPGRSSDECSLTLPKKLSGMGRSVIEEKLLSLCRYCQSPDLFKDFNKNSLLFDLLKDIGLESLPREESLADRIAAFLDSQTSKPFSKELVTSRFFLSYSYMAGAFRKEKGVSMGEYHNTARMREACRLLRSTALSVGETAEKTGFSDMLYFSRKFRRFSGSSPTEYRKKVQKKY